MINIEDIPVGRKNAISRDELRAKWGNISDREARRAVARLRTIDDGSNTIIVAVSRGRGYYRTDQIDEIEHFVNEMDKRARSTFRAARIARRALARLKRLEQHGGKGLGA